MTFKISDPAAQPRIPQYDPAAGSESSSDPDSPPLRNPHPLSGSEELSASVDNLNPARKQRFGLSLSAPAPESEAEILNSPAHASHSLFGWPGERPGRLAKLPARAPFKTMNPGLNIALAVELQRRALLALLTPEDKAELMIRNWRPPADEVPHTTFDVFVLARVKP